MQLKNYTRITLALKVFEALPEHTFAQVIVQKCIIALRNLGLKGQF